VIEYASTVWDPTTQSSINSLELIQRMAARFVNNDYKTRTPGCVTKMLDDLAVAGSVFQSLMVLGKNELL
jgi:hypothetical protein